MRKHGDAPASENECSRAAKIMMEWLVPSFEIVDPKPPYPPAWDHLADRWDHPIWAAAKVGRAQYIISENTRHFPPMDTDGRHVYEKIRYLTGDAFLRLLTGEIE